MTMHKLIVISMLAVTTVLALRYVSTFPVQGDYAPSRPAQLLESHKPAPVPASRTTGPMERRYDTEALKHLA